MVRPVEIAREPLRLRQFVPAVGLGPVNSDGLRQNGNGLLILALRDIGPA